MTLTDTGPLVAIMDRADPSHGQCVHVLSSLSMPLLTTLPCLTEAMQFLGKQFGWTGQQPLWEIVKTRKLQFAPLDGQALERVPALMKQYSDIPLDIADASILAIAEAWNFQQVFTLDNHFYEYRARSGKAFQIIPDRALV